jgi:hypothetical protein
LLTGFLLDVALALESGVELGRVEVVGCGAQRSAAAVSSAIVARAESRLGTSILALTCS